MDITIIILLLIVLYFLLTIKSDLNDKISYLEAELTRIREMLRQISLQRSIDESLKLKPKKKLTEPEKLLPITERAPLTEQQKETISPPPFPLKKVLPTPVEPMGEPSLSFFERHPDLEKFIGENLVNKIGIAVLVLSIGYFVKYAIDSNWIGPAGRVGIGILCGVILLGIAHRLRVKYHAFSSVLAGGGLAVFYFTMTLAYHQFHLFNQPVTFILLVLVTIFAVALSLIYNKQELAVIALVGGLASPFMVSTGNASYHTLFIYLLILNTGLLVIAFLRSWRILNASAFVLSVLIIAGVIFTLPAGKEGLVFLYAALFYLLFFTINLAYNIRENQPFISTDFCIILTNSALFFSAGLYLLTEMQQESFRGLFTIALAALNLCLSYILFRNKKVDTNVLYLLIGITLTFVSLTAPIQLEGHNITLFWASEAVLLYWLYLKSGIKLTQASAMLIWVLMLISLGMDWNTVYSYTDVAHTIVINRGFITGVFTSVSTFLLAMQVKQDQDAYLMNFKLPGTLLLVVSVVILFLTGLFEVHHQFINRYPQTQLTILYQMLYITAFVLSLTVILQRIKTTVLSNKTLLAIGSVCILIFLANTPQYFDLQRIMLMQKKISVNHFLAHWAGAILIIFLFISLIKKCRITFEDNLLSISTWVLCLVMVLFLSLEVSLISNHVFYSASLSISRIQTVYSKTGLPVLWGLSSFVMMWLGMKYKDRMLRIISLSIFLVTLLKLFLFDIRNIPAAGKIAAFFCLGVLLLSVSFMYQKVKYIIKADELPGDDV